jgi:hypothetical protein
LLEATPAVGPARPMPTARRGPTLTRPVLRPRAVTDPTQLPAVTDLGPSSNGHGIPGQS